jgi:hypothetical protein
MYIPNAFTPSTVIHQQMYDEEGRLKSFRIAPSRGAQGEGGISEANSLYSTDAELFGSVAPFLKRNRIVDARRRNYVIQPGGACIYFERPEELSDPYAHGRVQFTAPGDQESFGHNTQPGGFGGQPNQGRSFQVGAKSGGGR